MKNKSRSVSDVNFTEEMTDFQLARWLALVEGINLLADTAEDKGKRFSKVQIKQPALEEYVDSTSVLIFRALTGGAYR